MFRQIYIWVAASKLMVDKWLSQITGSGWPKLPQKTANVANKI